MKRERELVHRNAPPASIRVSRETRRRLTREAGRRTHETGTRWSIELLINDLADAAGVPREAS